MSEQDPGLLIRRTRTELGWSGRELARRAGVAQATLSRFEGGHDIAWEAAMRLATALPGLTPEELVGRRTCVPASARTWRAYETLHGASARRATMRVSVDEPLRQSSTLFIEGLRSRRRELRIPAHSLLLAGTVFDGPAALLWQLEASGGLRLGRKTRLHEGTVVHEIAVAGDPDRDGLTYRRGPRLVDDEQGPEQLGRPFAQGATAWIDLPVAELSLSVAFPEARRPAALTAWIWPVELAASPERPVNRWQELFPHAPERVATDAHGVAELRVRTPPPGLAVGLSWDDPSATERRAEESAARSPCVISPLRREPLRVALSAARKRAGWSQRELARRAGCSPATIQRAEAGSRPVVSQVRCLLRALPRLTTWHFARPPAGAPDREELWHEQRALHGLEVEEERRIVRLRHAGSELETHAVGIRWDRPGEAALGFRSGFTRAMQAAGRWELRSVSASARDPEPRIRVLRHEPGPVVHDVRLPRAAAGMRLDLVHRSSLDAQEARFVSGHSAPGEKPISNAFFAPRFPCRRLTCSLTFPRGTWPASFDLRVLTRSSPPADEAEDISLRLHPEGLSLELDERTRTARFVAELPLIGTRYVVAWRAE